MQSLSVDETGADQFSVIDWTPIFGASARGQIKVIQLLLAAGANVNQASNDGTTPLSLASQNGQTEIVKLVLESGANVKRPDKLAGHQYLEQVHVVK